MDEEKKTNEALLEEILYETVDNFANQVTGSKEREQEAANVVKIADALTRLKQTEIEKIDREERRRIEEEKNGAMLDLEEDKKVPFWQSCIEWVVKYIAPGCVSAFFFDKFQRRTLEFEETGIIKTKASKDLRSGWSFWK